MTRTHERSPLTDDLRCGDVVWVQFSPTQGREQSGRRPALVIAGDLFLNMVDTLAVVIPVTSTDRGWPNHIPLAGEGLFLERDSFAMTEQLRTISRSRIVGRAGRVNAETLAAVSQWLADFLDLEMST